MTTGGETELRNLFIQETEKQAEAGVAKKKGRETVT